MTYKIKQTIGFETGFSNSYFKCQSSISEGVIYAAHSKELQLTFSWATFHTEWHASWFKSSRWRVFVSEYHTLLCISEEIKSRVLLEEEKRTLVSGKAWTYTDSSLNPLSNPHNTVSCQSQEKTV